MLGSFLSLRRKVEFKWRSCSSIMEMLVLLCKVAMRVYFGECVGRRSYGFFWSVFRWVLGFGNEEV